MFSRGSIRHGGSPYTHRYTHTRTRTSTTIIKDSRRTLPERRSAAPRRGTSPANILAVFATADENKNFLFFRVLSFLRGGGRRPRDVLPEIRYGRPAHALKTIHPASCTPISKRFTIIATTCVRCFGRKHRSNNIIRYEPDPNRDSNAPDVRLSILSPFLFVYEL